MVSLKLTIAGALAVSTVFAHPLQYAEFHEKRQEAQTLVWVTLYQTQAAGPGGEPKVFTITSPMWVYASATGTESGNIAPTTAAILTNTGDAVPKNTGDAVPVPEPTSLADATSAVEPSSTTPFSTASSSIVQSSVTQSSAVQSLAGQFAQKQQAKPSSTTTSPLASGPTQGSPTTGGGKVTGQYQKYSGNPADYPPKSSWISFDELFESSKGDASKGMVPHGVTPDQMNQIKSAAQRVGDSSGIDPRIILAMIVQESHGVATEPIGLMQAGAACGVGWGNLDGIIKCSLDNYKGCTASYPQNDPWVALRCYNSGPNSGINFNNLSILTKNIGTAAYVDDIANRLAHGWTN